MYCSVIELAACHYMIFHITRDNNLYTTTNTCLLCLTKIMYTAF